jgi:hypothetical protein
MIAEICTNYLPYVLKVVLSEIFSQSSPHFCWSTFKKLIPSPHGNKLYFLQVQKDLWIQ